MNDVPALAAKVQPYEKMPPVRKECGEEQTTSNRWQRIGDQIRENACSRPDSTLPIEISGRKLFFETLANRNFREQHPALTITIEGLTYNRPNKSASFSWQEIDLSDS